MSDKIILNDLNSTPEFIFPGLYRGDVGVIQYYADANLEFINDIYRRIPQTVSFYLELAIFRLLGYKFFSDKTSDLMPEAISKAAYLTFENHDFELKQLVEDIIKAYTSDAAESEAKPQISFSREDIDKIHNDLSLVSFKGQIPNASFDTKEIEHCIETISNAIGKPDLLIVDSPELFGSVFQSTKFFDVLASRLNCAILTVTCNFGGIDFARMKVLPDLGDDAKILFNFAFDYMAPISTWHFGTNQYKGLFKGRDISTISEQFYIPDTDVSQIPIPARYLPPSVTDIKEFEPEDIQDDKFEEASPKNLGFTKVAKSSQSGGIASSDSSWRSWSAKSSNSIKIPVFRAMDINDLIGLETVKKQVKDIACFIKMRGRGKLPSLHMAFVGNPGTGKTEMARCLCNSLKGCHLFDSDDTELLNFPFVEVNRSVLVGQYIGETENRVRKIIQTALGGILFIDEAHSLYSAGSDSRDFGRFAIDGLVKAMEDYRDKFICIMAGYPKEMELMLDMNPGMRSRVQFQVDFPDYTSEELIKIFMHFCKDNEYQVSEEAETDIKKKFAYMTAHKDKNFANARIARNMYERIAIKQAVRISDSGEANNIITLEDIDTVFKDDDMSKLLHTTARAPLGFAEVSTEKSN